MIVPLFRYEVFCQNHQTHGVIGLSLTVITQTEKHRYGTVLGVYDKLQITRGKKSIEHYIDPIIGGSKRDFLGFLKEPLPPPSWLKSIT